MTFRHNCHSAAEKFFRSGCKALALEAPAGAVPTWFATGLVSWFAAQGLRLAVVHFSPAPDWGDAGKDTWKFRQAGANPVALTAPGLCQISYSYLDNAGFDLSAILNRLAPFADLILVVGPAPGPLPRIVLVESGAPSRFRESPEVIAWVDPGASASAPPVFSPRQIPELGRYLLARLSDEYDRKGNRH